MNRKASGNLATRFGQPGGPDPAATGRLGGLASGITRRNREALALEAKVLESNNGAAAVALLRLKLGERRRDLERRELEVAIARAQARVADDTVVRLLDEADEERKTIANLRAERDELDAELRTKREELASLELIISRLANEHDLELVDDADMAP